jgi:catechol 2,3-dioxygenase-like lactoylglutathione lyase family enzyme
MPEHKLQEIKNRTDGHIDHVAFDVDDIEKTFELIRNEGLTIIENEPVFLDFWAKGCRYFNILGPDGERIEFNQILT